MTPAGARDTLDRQLQANGRDVTLRRFTGPQNAPLSSQVDTVVRAKEAPATAAELAAGIQMTGRRLIMSPTDVGMNAIGSGAPKPGTDAIMIDGTKRVIEVWTPQFMGNEPVRYEVQIRGN